MNSQIHILGPLKLQNALLASYLQIQTGLICFRSSDLDLSPVLTRGQRALVLWDSGGKGLDELLAQLDRGLDSNRAKVAIALFNATRDTEVVAKQKKVILDIDGIFFEHDPLEVIPKGVLAILNGDRWLPRNILADYVLEAMVGMNTSGGTKATLTKREKEMLLAIASGASNGEIADQFCISYHTVKTHVVNVYKKINAKNRLQATFWAAKNL